MLYIHDDLYSEILSFILEMYQRDGSSVAVKLSTWMICCQEGAETQLNRVLYEALHYILTHIAKQNTYLK